MGNVGTALFFKAFKILGWGDMRGKSSVKSGDRPYQRRKIKPILSIFSTIYYFFNTTKYISIRDITLIPFNRLILITKMIYVETKNTSLIFLISFFNTSC